MHCPPSVLRVLNREMPPDRVEAAPMVTGLWRVRSPVDGYRALLPNSTRSSGLFAEVAIIKFGPELFALYVPGSPTPD
jgi:hypothetical protein